MSRLEIAGKKYGLLTAIECVGKDEENCTLWKFRCDCGNEVIRKGYLVKRGNTKSCGCLLQQRGKWCRKHGQSRTRLYRIWENMKFRCGKERYGKIYAEIDICDEWKTFEPFSEWALANGYQDGLSIDRIDNSGNYEPSNCRWATPKQQSNNTSRNHYILYGGNKKTISEWAEYLGVSRQSIYSRLSNGESEEEVIKHFYNKTK